MVHILMNFMVGAGFIGEGLFNNLQIIMCFIIASFSKTWYIESLKAKKYKLKSIIAAKNLDEAKLKFYQSISKEECHEL
jgi:hypothetical protein